MKPRIVLVIMLVLALTLGVFTSAGAAAPFCNITSQTRYMWDGTTYSITWNSGKTTQIVSAQIRVPVGSRSSYGPGGWWLYDLTVTPADVTDRTGAYTGTTVFDLPLGTYGGAELGVTYFGGVWCKAEIPGFTIAENPYLP